MAPTDNKYGIATETVHKAIPQPNYLASLVLMIDSKLGHAIDFLSCCLTGSIKGRSDVVKTKIEKIKKTPSDHTYADILKMSLWLK